MTARVFTRQRRLDEEFNEDQTAIDFERWWRLYPKKLDKKVARDEYFRIVQTGKMKPCELLDALNHYVQVLEARGDIDEWIIYPSTWLLNERWEDEEEVVYRPNRKDPEDVYRRLFPGNDRAAKSEHAYFWSRLMKPARALRLTGADDEAVLVYHLGMLLLEVKRQRAEHKFKYDDESRLYSRHELVWNYLEWIKEQDWPNASTNVLKFESRSFTSFRLMIANHEEHGRDPITSRSIFI